MVLRISPKLERNYAGNFAPVRAESSVAPGQACYALAEPIITSIMPRFAKCLR
jgi:hypothetical protein